MRLLLTGLAARRGINLAIGLVAAIATCAAVLGPMYGRAATEHLVDVRLGELAPYGTGLTVSVSRPDVDPQRLVDEASDDLASDPRRERYWPDETPWLLDGAGTIVPVDREFTVPLYWRAGMCDLAVVDGSCPAAPGEVLVQETTAARLELAIGDALDVTYPGAPRGGGADDGPPTTRRFQVVGTYRIDDPQSPAWFDSSRFTGIADLRAPASTGSGSTPKTPALLTDPATFAASTTDPVTGGVDRPVDLGAVDLATLDDVVDVAAGYQDDVDARQAEGTTDDDPDQLGIAAVADRIAVEQTLFERITVAALVPLLVLALLLLHALAAASTAQRRPYVALAQLRGHARRRVLGFAVGEPVAVLALAVPLGVVAAALLARAVAAAWLSDGIPVAVGGTAWALLAVLVAATLLACLVAALPVVREPLARALSAALPEPGGSRTALVLRSAVVAAAVVVVALLVTSDDRDDQVLALVSPLVLSLAVGVVGGWLLRRFARGWTSASTGASRPSTYLAARRLARRPDLAQLMVPLLVAVSLLSFAVATTSVSDAWRDSRARAEVGADRTYLADVPAGRMLAVSREVDPEGRYLMAVAFETDDDDLARRVFVDSTRLARVAAWDPTWSDEPVADLQRELAPSADRITFAGSRLEVDVADVALDSPSDEPAHLWVAYVDEDGETRRAELGVLRNRPGTRTLTGEVSFCAGGCTLDQLLITGDSLSVYDAVGSLRVTGARVDGTEADWRLTEPDAWRPARPFPVSVVDPPVLTSSGPDGLLLDVDLGELAGGDGPGSPAVSGIARVTPSVTPDLAPVVVAAGTATAPADRPGSGRALDLGDAVAGVGLDGTDQPMRVVAEASALPVVGTEGVLADLRTSLVEHPPPAGATLTVQLWTAPGTPDAVLEQVEAAGVPLVEVGDLDATNRALHEDAFSLALRVFLVVALATALLAALGTFAGTVLQTRWRAYEVASLRLVRVPPRTLVRATLLEYGVMLGLAVVLGVLAALAVIGLALPALDLGPAGPFEPEPEYAPPWLLVVGVGAGLLVVAVLLALVIARRTARLGRPSSLRWAETA